MGKYTIRQVLQNTLFTPEFKNRIEYSGRDVLRTIRIQEVTQISRGAILSKSPEGITKFRVITSSYPQYEPYISQRSKGAKRQRKIKHKYNIILEMDRLSVNTTNWVMRVGSTKRLRKAPQILIGQIYTDTKNKWYKQALRKAKDNKTQAKKMLSERIKKHKKRAKYINEGDWIAKVLGVNLDWFYTFQRMYTKYGHLYGPDTTNQKSPRVKNPRQILAFDKHSVRFIQYLLNKGVLKND